MMYFPVFTQIEGKRCLIVGGGKVAARKVHTLLQYRADVVVIAKKVCDEIKEVLPEKSIFEDFIKIQRILCDAQELHLLLWRGNGHSSESLCA